MILELGIIASLIAILILIEELNKSNRRFKMKTLIIAVGLSLICATAFAWNPLETRSEASARHTVEQAQGQSQKLGDLYN